MTIDTNNILNNIQLQFTQILQPNKIEDNNSVDKIFNDSINSDIDSTKANLMAYNDAIGYMQIAQGVLEGVAKETEILQKLDVAVHNDALNSEDKNILRHQMQEIKKGITQTLTNTTYNGINVFNHSFKLGDESISLEVSSDSLDINDSKSIEKFAKFIHNTLSDIASFSANATKKSEELSAKFVNEAYSKAQFEPDVAKDINLVKNEKLQFESSILASVHNTDLLAEQMQTLLG